MPNLEQLPEPKKRGPKRVCECNECPRCLNRIRVARHRRKLLMEQLTKQEQNGKAQ